MDKVSPGEFQDIVAVIFCAGTCDIAMEPSERPQQRQNVSSVHSGVVVRCGVYLAVLKRVFHL